LGNEIIPKSVHFLLFALVIVGTGKSRWSACSGVHCRANWQCLTIGWGQCNGCWLAA